MNLAPGTRLGPYAIEGTIGSGGMGEVYRARDARLDRSIAVKILPDNAVGDAQSRARFEQEARAASALNHPNIVTIHDIGNSDGVLYIAMELVEGKTLREILAPGPLPLRRLLTLASQVADGIASAHAAGITHRDLKPDNLMVNKDGFVKILDFGLAKPLASIEEGSESATRTAPGTHPGAILGTVGYMSPEQASGGKVGFRSDQFSLGSILYEMATGKRAFQKKTAVQTLSAIIQEEPEPIAALSPASPPALRWIVERCLAKEPDDRYASTTDLARDLKQTLEHLSDISGEAPAVEKPGKRRPYWAAALLLLAGLVALDIRLRALHPSGGNAPSPVLRRVTFAPGLNDEPAWSPDGKFLAYTTDERGNLDVVVMPLSGGKSIRISESDADDSQPAWSPDGSKLAFVSARDHGGRLGIALNLGVAFETYVNAKHGDIFIAPALGGSAAKLVEDGYYPAWSPDGRQIVFMSGREGQFDLWVVPSEGGSPTRLTHDPDFNFQPAWSPDGQWVAFGSGDQIKGYNLWVVRAAGGTKQRLTGDFGYVTRPAWSADGKSIFFSGARNGILNVWRVPFSPGTALAEPSRVTVGQGQDSSLSISRDGRRLAFAAARNEANIWELTLATGALRPVTSGAGGADFPQISPDGKTLLVESARTGEFAVWTTDLTGKFLSQLTPGQGVVEPGGRWSPDGTQIAYLRDKSVYIQPIGGMTARKLGVPVGGGFFTWSPDGQTIAVAGQATEGSGAEIGVFSLREERFRPVTALKRTADNPAWSPDGKRLAFYTQRGQIRELWVVSAEGGPATQLTRDSEDSHPAWSPRNPDEILFLRDHKRLAILSVSTGKVRFPPSYTEGSYILDYPSWSPDAKHIYFSARRKTGDIYVLEGL